MFILLNLCHDILDFVLKPTKKLYESKRIDETKTRPCLAVSCNILRSNL